MSELEHDDEVDKNQIVEQGLIEELCSSTEIASAIENTSSTETSISCDKSEYTILGESETQSSAFSAQHLSCLFKTAIKSRQQEILNWYYYSLEFEKRVHAITADALRHSPDGPHSSAENYAIINDRQKILPSEPKDKVDRIPYNDLIEELD
ncbi:9252_t:CDS:2 [Entrophospora sp. SA101]|nr:9252_t:CDS:2 [Entrophospora sp. SA101]